MRAPLRIIAAALSSCPPPVSLASVVSVIPLQVMFFTNGLLASESLGAMHVCSLLGHLTLNFQKFLF